MLVVAGCFTGCYLGDYPNGVAYDNWPAISLVFLLWGLYGLIKGIYHEATWLRESWNDEHHHSTTEHPYLLMGASAGMHYILKKTLGKKD
jgi:disulfide bond formation protein DsbB